MAVKIQKGTALTSLSLTPLVDVVFLLLIFFLVATRFAQEERELELALPEASAAKPLVVKPREMFINITADGQFYVAGKILNADQLEAVLKQAWSNNQGRQRVVIRADEDSKTKHVTLVMNLCNKANIRSYTLATK